MEQVEVAVFAAIFLISSALTRIFLRKKERFPPGPFPLPVIGHLHLHQTFHDLSKHYGPLMQLRLGSTTFVVVSSPELVKECLKTQDLVFSSRKQSTAIDIITYYSSFAFGPITSYWKFVKKLCTYELLGARNLLHFQPLRALEVNSFLQILMRKGISGESFNLTEELVKLTSNVISNMMLSIRCSRTEGEMARTVVREVTQIFGEFDVADIIWVCKNFDLQGIKKRSISSLSGRSSGASAGVARDFLDMFLDIMESGKAEVTFTREHLKALILESWKFIKKLCTYELLGARNLLHFQPLRTLEVNTFLQILLRKGKSGESFNLTEELVKLMSNVISHMMLSIRCSGTEGEGEAEAEAEVARTVIREVTQIFGEFDVADIIWLCKNFDLQGIKKRSLDIQRRYDALLENIITASEKQRRSGAASGEARDFLDIMESGNAEVTFTREHLKDLILDFFTAGTDTTAIVSEWAIAELINNPRVLKKAQEEIVKVIGFERVLQESDGPNLPYLQAVIKETFRLRPPIPMLARKSISDCIIDRYTVPANSLLFVNLWSMGRNPKIWDSPAEFLPEQFLEKANSAIDIKGQHFELLPFGRGWRGCPGMLLGIQEVVIIIGSMIQCFEWKLPDGSTTVDMTERPGLTAPRAEDLICRIDPSVVSVSV
ncbi:hypothetical protein SASPL_120160 [Salvia splendens]|uniref:Uncharacterized protein n=1 Tax=Salvia splendens TaxID=180675 RepID=A0A8X8XU12_SALSN|nr:hypothetical protein SASPL_120160 [Salvia splendens]